MSKTHTVDPSLIAEANDLCSRVVDSLRRTLTLAKQAGDILKQIKRMVGHGNWKQWVAQNLDAKYRTVAVYMRISSQWAKLERDAEGNPKLTIEAALEKLHHKKSTQLRPPCKSTFEFERSVLRDTFAIHMREMTDQEVEFLAGESEEPGTNRLSAFLDDLRNQIRTGPKLRRIA